MRKMLLSLSGTHAGQTLGGMSRADIESHGQKHDNVLIQDLIESGVWSDYDLLLKARENLREEVRESCSDPRSFLAQESRAALKLVSDRLRVF